MKIMVKVTLITTAIILSSVVMHSMAMHKKTKPYTYTIHNLSVTAANPNKKTLIDCSQFTNKSYSFSTASKQRSFAKNLYLINSKWKMKNKKHGLSITKWCATAVFVDKSGKKHTRKAYGRGVSITGSHMSFGVFNNGFCKGFYKSTW